jgi:hypothetical protein
MQRMQQQRDRDAIQQLQRSSSSAGVSIGLGGRRALKQERELTDALIAETQSTSPSEIVQALIAEGQRKMTAAQHQEFRATFRRVVESEGLVRDAAALSRRFVLEHPSPAGGDEQLAQATYINSIDMLERLASLNYYENAGEAINQLLTVMQDWADHLRGVR